MISQTIFLEAPPEKVYDCLMNEKKHSEFTNASAKIEPEVNGSFSVWDGYATGKTLELVLNKKIVQSWRASDWPENVFSTAAFEFLEKDNGTSLTFTQVGIPEEFEKDIEKGWEDFYWKPLKKYLVTN
jgi:activator of HSP90 ATPase